MKLTSRSFENGRRIPERNAMGKRDPKTHATASENLNPHFEWSDLPPGTRSLALTCIDTDAPPREDSNRADKHITYDWKRGDFVHWVLVDLKPEPNRIEEGEFNKGITARGKKGPEGGPRGTRQGLNDYTKWFAGDADMEGKYFGYDGPWPPWNDARAHRYVFTLHALDVDRCPVSGAFTAEDMRRAIEGHVLAKASLVGIYAINADAKE